MKLSIAIAIAALVLLFLLGCGKKKTFEVPNSVATIQETPLIASPPPPEFEPIKTPIIAADKKADTLAVMAQKSPEGKVALPIIAGVKADHAAAIAATNVAEKRSEEVQKVGTKNDQIQEKNLADFKASAATDKADAKKIIDDQNETIGKLENAKYDKAASWYFWISVVLMLGGVGSIAAMLTVGFPAGLKVGLLCIPVGAFSMWVSFHIHTIDTWIGWAVIASIVAGVAYLVWHGFRRDPNAPVHKLQVVKMPKGPSVDWVKP